MHTGLSVLCLVAVAHALSSSVHEFDSFRQHFGHYGVTWNHFKRGFGKAYQNYGQERKRYNIFKKNIQVIERHNWKYAHGKSSYFMGITQFTDMTVDEYVQYNKLQEPRQSLINCTFYRPPLMWALPATVDWRKRGYVTHVKDQRSCGSCWAFSATGSLEGQHFRQTGKLVSLSEQQLVDCAGVTGNHGCNGGLMDKAFHYINSAGGLQADSDYPYEASDEKCRFDKSKAVTSLSACQNIPHGNEHILQVTVATMGPVSVAIDVAHASFMHYKGGVFSEPKCSSFQLNHGVLAVGYGSVNGSDYWLVKNSWGTGWGIEGYVMMSRNKNNQCGIATFATFPLI